MYDPKYLKIVVYQIWYIDGAEGIFNTKYEIFTSFTSKG